VVEWSDSTAHNTAPPSQRREEPQSAVRQPAVHKPTAVPKAAVAASRRSTASNAAPRHKQATRSAFGKSAKKKTTKRIAAQHTAGSLPSSPSAISKEANPRPLAPPPKQLTLGSKVWRPRRRRRCLHSLPRPAIVNNDPSLSLSLPLSFCAHPLLVPLTVSRRTLIAGDSVSSIHHRSVLRCDAPPLRTVD
jgi:hypothetical protein